MFSQRRVPNSFDFTKYAIASLQQVIYTKCQARIAIVGKPIQAEVDYLSQNIEILFKSYELLEFVKRNGNPAVRSTPFNVDSIINNGNEVMLGMNSCVVKSKDKPEIEMKSISGVADLKSTTNYGVTITPNNPLVSEIVSDVVNYAAVVNGKFESTVPTNVGPHMVEYHPLGLAAVAKNVLSELSFPETGSFSGNKLGDYLYPKIANRPLDQLRNMYEDLSGADPQGVKLLSKYKDFDLNDGLPPMHLRAIRMHAATTLPELDFRMLVAFEKEVSLFIGSTSKGSSKFGINMNDGFPLGDDLRKYVNAWLEVKNLVVDGPNYIAIVSGDANLAAFLLAQLPERSVVALASDNVLSVKDQQDILDKGGLLPYIKLGLEMLGHFSVYYPKKVPVSVMANSKHDILEQNIERALTSLVKLPNFETPHLFRVNYMLLDSIFPKKEPIKPVRPRCVIDTYEQYCSALDMDRCTKDYFYNIADPKTRVPYLEYIPPLVEMENIDVICQHYYDLYLKEIENKIEASYQLKIAHYEQQLAFFQNGNSYHVLPSPVAHFKKILVLYDPHNEYEHLYWSRQNIIDYMFLSLRHLSSYSFTRVPFMQTLRKVFDDDKVLPENVEDYSLLPGSIKMIRDLSILTPFGNIFSTAISNDAILPAQRENEKMLEVAIMGVQPVPAVPAIPPFQGRRVPVSRLSAEDEHTRDVIAAGPPSLAPAASVAIVPAVLVAPQPTLRSRRPPPPPAPEESEEGVFEMKLGSLFNM